jgi:hypothetical protein
MASFSGLEMPGARSCRQRFAKLYRAEYFFFAFIRPFTRGAPAFEIFSECLRKRSRMTRAPHPEGSTLAGAAWILPAASFKYWLCAEPEAYIPLRPLVTYFAKAAIKMCRALNRCLAMQA